MIWIPIFLSFVTMPSTQYIIPFAKPAPAPEKEARVSIAAGDIPDLSWQAVLMTVNPAERPAPVTLPFLADFPFENFEVKVKLFRMPF